MTTRKGFVFVIGLLCCASSAFLWAAPTQENFFLINPHHEPREKLISKRHRQIELGLGAIFEEMIVPVVVEGEIRRVKYYQHLDENLQRKFPDLNVGHDIKTMPSAGVVRAGLSLEIFLLWKALNDTPSGEFDIDAFFQSLADKTHPIFRGGRGIMAHQVRGPGSDLDTLFEAPDGLEKDVAAVIDEVTNSIETALGLTEAAMPKGLKRSLLTISDAKSYRYQIERAAAQGGVTLDFLAFDREKKEVREPGAHLFRSLSKKSILDLFIEGFWEYVAALNSEVVVEDPHKQTGRGIRPFVEFPSHRLWDAKVFLSDFENLEKMADQPFPEKVKAQLQRATSNSRFGGGFNRLYRGERGSEEARIHKVLVKQRDLKSPTIPKFVDTLPLGRKEKLAIPAEFLISREQFLRLAPEEILYHGAPDIETGLAILRKALILSTEDNVLPSGRITQASEGEGAYATPHRDEAFHRYDGYIFKLPVKSDPRVKIVDWQKMEKSAFGQRLIREAASREPPVSPFQILREEAGVDLIWNTYFLIQNNNAIDFPEELGDLVEAYGTYVENRKHPPYERWKAYAIYLSIYRMAKALGEVLGPEIDVVEELKAWAYRTMKRPPDLEAYSTSLKMMEGIVRDEEFDEFVEKEWGRFHYGTKRVPTGESPDPYRLEFLNLLLRKNYMTPELGRALLAEMPSVSAQLYPTYFEFLALIAPLGISIPEAVLERLNERELYFARYRLAEAFARRARAQALGPIPFGIFDYYWIKEKHEFSFAFVKYFADHKEPEVQRRIEDALSSPSMMIAQAATEGLGEALWSQPLSAEARDTLMDRFLAQLRRRVTATVVTFKMWGGKVHLDEAQVDKVLAMVQDTSHPAVAANAVDALLQYLDEPRVIETLVKVAATAADPKPREAAVFMLQRGDSNRTPVKLLTIPQIVQLWESLALREGFERKALANLLAASLFEGVETRMYASDVRFKEVTLKPKRRKIMKLLQQRGVSLLPEQLNRETMNDIAAQLHRQKRCPGLLREWGQ